MVLRKWHGLLQLALLSQAGAFAQPGTVSVGGRSTLSLFGHDGAGIGTGGQFRIQFTNRVNSDWFLDYISLDSDDGVRSEYLHIGWSVLFYPLPPRDAGRFLQPYVLAGHCFDYNKKTVLASPDVNKSRFGSAVQAGLGTHFNLTDKFDLSLTAQYMIHLTKELEVIQEDGIATIADHSHSTLQGHLLTTLSFNYKLFRLWNR